MKYLLVVATLILIGCQSHPLISNRKVECSLTGRQAENIWWRRPVYKSPDSEWDKFNTGPDRPAPVSSLTVVSVAPVESSTPKGSSADSPKDKYPPLEDYHLEEF